MVGWHHWLDGHEFEQALGVGDGQGGLVCCSPWGHRIGHDWVTELKWRGTTNPISLSAEMGKSQQRFRNSGYSKREKPEPFVGVISAHYRLLQVWAVEKETSSVSTYFLTDIFRLPEIQKKESIWEIWGFPLQQREWEFLKNFKSLFLFFLLPLMNSF